MLLLIPGIRNTDRTKQNILRTASAIFLRRNIYVKHET